MGSFNILKVMLWTTFIIVILLTNKTEQKSLYKPIQPENGNIAKAAFFGNPWPLYYRRVSTSDDDDDDDDVVDSDSENDKMIKTLMEEIVAKSRFVDTVDYSMMDNNDFRLKANRKDVTLESRPEEQEGKTQPELHENEFGANDEKAKMEENSLNAKRDPEKKTMNNMSEEELKNKENKAPAEVMMNTPIKFKNKIENRDVLSENFNNNQELELATHSLNANNDDNNTKVKPDESLSGITENKDTTTAAFDEEDTHNTESLSHDNDENKTAEKNLAKKETENQATMESLKESEKPILNKEKSDESKQTQQETLDSVNFMKTKDFEYTQVNKPLSESTESHTDNKIDEVVTDLKQETTNPTTIERSNELKSISNQEKSEELQPTRQETLNSDNVMNSKDLNDKQVKESLIESTENDTKNKDNEEVNDMKEKSGNRTMENLNELQQILNEEKIKEPKQTQQETLNSVNVMNSKELEDTEVKKPLIEFTVSLTANKQGEEVNDMQVETLNQTTVEIFNKQKPISNKEKSENRQTTQKESLNIGNLVIKNYKEVNDLKERNASQAPKESLQELKPILNEEKDEKLQLTQQENIKIKNLVNSKELEDIQVNKPSMVSLENKKSVVVNEDVDLKEPQKVNFINFTTISDNTNIRQAEEIIATKQNDVVLKIQLDDLQVKAPEIKKIGKINGVPDKVALEEAEKDIVKHDIEDKPLKLTDQDKKPVNDESKIHKEASGNSSIDFKQSLSNKTKAPYEIALKNEEKILVDIEKNISEFDKNLTETTLKDKIELPTKTTGNKFGSNDLILKVNYLNVSAAITDRLPEKSEKLNEKPILKTTVANEETKENKFGETNFINVPEKEATELIKKEVNVSKIEDSKEHVLEQPDSMVKKNKLEGTTTLPFIVYAVTAQESTENSLEPTNFIVKQNEEKEAATIHASGFSKAEGVTEFYETQQNNSTNDGKKVSLEKLENEINIEESIPNTNLYATQQHMDETTEKYYKDATQDEKINDETENTEINIFNATEFFHDSKDGIKTIDKNQQKLSTEVLIKEILMQPLEDNSSNKEILVNTTSNESESLIKEDNAEIKLNITSTENSMSISDYVSKVIEALKPAIQVYGRKKSNTTKLAIMQSVLNDVNSPQIAKEPIQMESQNIQNTEHENKAEYTFKESNEVTSTEKAENDATKEPQKLSSAIEDFSIVNAEVESSTLQASVEKVILEEPLKAVIKINMDHKKPPHDGNFNEVSKTKVQEEAFLREQEPAVMTENSNLKMGNEHLTATENFNILKAEMEQTTDNAMEESNVTEFAKNDPERLMQDPVNSETMYHTIKDAAEIEFIKIETLEHPKTTITDELKNDTEETLEETPHVSAEFMEKPQMLMKEAVTESIFTGNKNSVTLDLKEKLQDSSDNNKNQMNTINVEELNNQTKEVLSESPEVEAASDSTTNHNKNAEISFSWEEKLENRDDNNKNQPIINSVEKENVESGDEMNDQMKEDIMTQIKNTVASSGLEEKPEASTIDNKHEITMSTVEKQNTKIVEELNEQVKEVFDKTILSGAVSSETTTNGNKNTEASSDLVVSPEDPSYSNNSQISNITIEEENEENGEELDEQTKEVATTGNKGTNQPIIITAEKENVDNVDEVNDQMIEDIMNEINNTVASSGLEEKPEASTVDNKNEISISTEDKQNSKIFEEFNEQIKKVFNKTILSDAVSESTTNGNKTIEASLSLEDMPEVTFDNKESQISKTGNLEELNATGNKNTKTSSDLEEKPENASVIAVDKPSIVKNVDGLNEQMKEGSEKPFFTETESTTTSMKNTETTPSSEKEREETSDNSKNQLNNNTVEKKNRKSDEQNVNEEENSKQVFKLEHFLKNADYTETVKAEEQKESSWKMTTVPPIFITNKENYKIEKITLSPPPITSGTINQNQAQTNENPENLLIKTNEANDDDDDQGPNQPYYDNYDKNLPIIKSSKITKLNEDVTTTVTCITTFQSDSLRNAEEKNTRQTITNNNDLKTIENNAVAANDDAANHDDGNNDNDSLKQQLNDKLSPELKFVTWQTYSENKLKGYQAEELTGKQQQNLESIAADDNHDNDINDGTDAYNDDADDDDVDDSDDDDDDIDDNEEDDDDDYDGDIDVAHDDAQKFDEINDGKNENTNKNVEVADAFAGKLTANGDKHKTDVSKNVDGQFLIPDQVNDFDSVTNDPHLSSSIKHYRINDNTYGNRKNQLEQMKEMEQMKQQYPDTKPYNAEKDIFSEVDKLPTTKSATPTTTNWWSTLQYEEIRKFLNTIFYAAADDIYREIARKAKEAQLREAKKIEEDQRKAKESWKQSNEWSLS